MNNKTQNAFGTGFLSEILFKVRLTINLLKDKRISMWVKLIPAACLLYLIMPLDFLFGPIDDAVVLYFGMDMFIDLCPAAVVQEYRDMIKGEKKDPKQPEIIEGEFKK